MLLSAALVACGGAAGAPGTASSSRAPAVAIATLTPTVQRPLASVSSPQTPALAVDATASPPSTAEATSTTPTQTAATPAPAATQSPSPTAAATATVQATATAETPVPAPPPPSPTAPPAQTPAATVPAGSLQVVGSAGFVSWTNQALALLQNSAPTWYAQVQRYLSEILEVPTGTGRITVGTRTFQAGPDTVYPPTLSPTQQLDWYAGSIVHDSCHERLYETGQQFKGKDAEIACLQDQEAALRQITSDPFLANYVQGLIDGADDPANQYWLHPHW